MPMGGGVPERIEGTDGLHLLSWPLAVDFGAKESGSTYRNQTRVVNLETGRGTEVKAPEGVKNLRCGPTWCFGDWGDEVLVQKLDGSDRKTLPGLSSRSDANNVSGRFGMLDAVEGANTGDYLSSLVVYDPDSGFTVRMGTGNGGTWGRGISSPTSILYWDEGKKQVRECKTVDGRILPPQASGEPVPTGESTVCSTKEVGGGKELTVVNLLAVPPTE